MSRWEFMRQLEELLSDISPYEREEALQYYNDYFNDAGRENEGAVIEALGSPEQVARIVKDGLGENGSQGEFTEKGFTNSASEEKKNEIIKRAETENTENKNPENKNTSYGTDKESISFKEDAGRQESRAENFQPQNTAGSIGSQTEGMPTWGIVLIVLGCILLSPAILGLAGSILTVIFVVIVALIAVVFGFGVTAVVLIAVAVALVAAGIACTIVAPLKAIGLIGGGFVCAALGILFILLTAFIAGQCIPGICRGIAYIFKSIFGKKEGAKA